MQPEKKQLEVLMMHYFRECHPEFPKGQLIASESPDFILKLKTKQRIGIEITRLNPLNSRVPDMSLLEQQKIQDRIIESARLLFLQSSSLKLFVKFLFADAIPLEEEREISVTVSLADAIRKTVQLRKTNGFFYLSVVDNLLPHGIEGILIVYHPSMKVSIWERSNNLGISEDVIGDLHQSILKKDEKLLLYRRQNLNSYWLIIITDRLRGVKKYNIHDKMRNHIFKSRFQHVFLFDLAKSTVLSLV